MVDFSKIKARIFEQANITEMPAQDPKLNSSNGVKKEESVFGKKQPLSQEEVEENILEKLTAEFLDVQSEIQEIFEKKQEEAIQKQKEERKEELDKKWNDGTHYTYGAPSSEMLKDLQIKLNVNRDNPTSGTNYLKELEITTNNEIVNANPIPDTIEQIKEQVKEQNEAFEKDYNMGKEISQDLDDFAKIAYLIGTHSINGQELKDLYGVEQGQYDLYLQASDLAKAYKSSMEARTAEENTYDRYNIAAADSNLAKISDKLKPLLKESYKQKANDIEQKLDNPNLTEEERTQLLNEQNNLNQKMEII